ncbi:MAG: ATP-grasp domain-containing protein [Prevotella sp.]|nr:ATP-grasp domain-containing protein [Prevotella sp.]
MSKKRIMILGGNLVQTDAIRCAHELGYHVICADEHRDAPGHCMADEQCYIDISDREAVLREARERHIDGIIPYASDALATVAAYVGEQLHLPGNPLLVIETMTQKPKFRRFMQEHGFPVPQAEGCRTIDEALQFMGRVGKPVMIKPADASGSKGVFRVCSENELREHWSETQSYSQSGEVVVEEYIDSVGLQQDGDIFVSDGEVKFWGVCDQRKDVAVSPFAPAMLSFPSMVDSAVETRAKQLMQQVITALGFRMGACNVEYVVDRHGEVYILEIGPRNGGNMIPYVIKEATGFDILAATICQAVGDEPVSVREIKKRYAMSVVVHSKENGTLRGITLAESVRGNVCRQLMFMKEGDRVHVFRNGRDTVGLLVFCFDSAADMQSAIESGVVEVEVAN